MEEQGTVIGREHGKVQVRIERSQSCEGCHGCLYSDTGTYMIAEAVDKVGVSNGDIVRLETQSASPVGASMLLFGIPLVMIFAGYGVGSAVAPLMNMASSAQGIGIAGAGVFFAASFGILAIVGRKGRKGKEERSAIVEILDHTESQA